MKKSLINRAVVGVLLASSACLTTNYLLAQTPAPATSAPAAPASQPGILASVNGQDIDTAKFNQLLMSIAGMRLLEQVIDLIVAEQACGAAGINVNAPEFQKNVQDELDRALNDLANQGVPKEQRGAALQQILQKQGVTNQEFQMGLRRAACLRALAKGKVTLTEENLKDAYEADYGEKAIGRLTIVRTLEDANAVRKAVEGGKDFTEASTAHNLQSQAVTLPKSAKGDAIKTLKERAFAMKEKTITEAIQQPDGTWVLFYLDKKDPSTTDVNKFDAALKEKLRDKYTEQGERAWANNHLQNLRRMANIKINDQVLSEQYRAVIERLNAAATQAAAATQNATNPAATNPTK